MKWEMIPTTTKIATTIATFVRSFIPDRYTSVSVRRSTAGLFSLLKTVPFSVYPNSPCVQLWI